MIPLRDKNPSHSVPFVTWALIAVNAAVFVHELRIDARLGLELDAFIKNYALTPAVWKSAKVALFEKWSQVVTSMFLHGSFLHFLSNAWSLWIFGDNVEDRLGHFKYLVFYLLCGVAAAGVHVGTNWGSDVPVLGASGAIAGVMGAYLVMFPRAKVVTVVPVFIFMHYAEVPALFFLGFWFLIQLYSGIAATGTGAVGIAWWAHIGGFAAGIYWAFRLRPAGAKRR